MSKKTYDILAVGDIQICPKSHALVDKLLNETLLEEIKQCDADVVVFPGDLFEFSNYTNNYVSAAQVIVPYSKFFDALTRIKRNTVGRKFSGYTPVEAVLVDGNHDKTYGSYANANDIFRGSHIAHASSSVSRLDRGPVSFIMVPWLMPHEHGNRAELLGEIRSLVAESKAAGLLPVLVAHMRVVGAHEHNFKVKQSEYSFNFTKDELESLGIEYGILGDIHHQQNVVKHIDYIGSIRQRHFGEAQNGSFIRHISVDVATAQVVKDKYKEISWIPRHIILTAKDESELLDLLNTYDFESNNVYRIEIDFVTAIKSNRINVGIRSTVRQSRNESKASKMPKITKFEHEELIKTFNGYSNILDEKELIEALKFYREHKQ